MAANKRTRKVSRMVTVTLPVMVTVKATNEKMPEAWQAVIDDLELDLEGGLIEVYGSSISGGGASFSYKSGAGVVVDAGGDNGKP